MHVGVVHQIAIHFESLIVDVDATRDSPIAMSLVRSDNIQLEVTRNGKTYLVVDGGELSHGQLNFSPSAHFSARLTLFESVQGNFQPKTMTLTLRDASGLHGKSNNKKKMFTSVGQIEVSDHAGDKDVSIQVQFGEGVALLFATVTCMRTEGDALSPEHQRRDRGLSLDSVASVAVPVSREEKKFLEQRSLQRKFNALQMAPLPPSIPADGGGFTCRVCRNTWKGSRTCILCDSYSADGRSGGGDIGETSVVVAVVAVVGVVVVVVVEDHHHPSCRRKGELS